MAPRRGPKRPNDEDERPNKRAAKGKKQPTYDTYDECLDGGVEMEEKGERYRDGEKAQRFYERALELYEKAFRLHATFDSAYNQARVLYTLGTSFYLPPESTAQLQKSNTLYQKATELSNSPLLLLDATFNMGQGYIALADQLEDVDASRDQEILGYRMEAGRVLQDVLDGQEEFLKRQRDVIADEQDEDEPIEEVEGDAADAGEMDVDGEQGGDEEESFETYLPTPSTYIDTVLALVDLHLSIWESTDPPAPPQDNAQATVRSILDRAAQFVPSGRQAELDLAEIKVLLSVDSIVWDMYRVEARAGSGAEKSNEGAIMVLTRLLGSLDEQPPDEPTLRAEILTILADTHTALANRSVWLLPQLPPGPSPLAQQAWYHYSQAITVLTKALELPITPQTPRDFKSSVLLSLSEASLRRAKLAIGGRNDTAQRNAVQLMENAVNYGIRAADGLGWTGTNVFTRPSDTVTAPAQAGWDTESLARKTLLQLLRISYYGHKQTDIPLPEGDRTKYASAAERMSGLMKKVVPESRRIHAKAVTDWLEELEEDERIEEEEKVWWRQVI